MTVSFLGRSFYSLVKYFSCFQTIRTPQCWKLCETNSFFLPPFRQDVEKEGLMNRFSDFASSFFRRGDGAVIIFGFRHPWETDFVHQGSLSSAFAFLNWWTAQSIPIPCGILMVRKGHRYLCTQARGSLDEGESKMLLNLRVDYINTPW